MDNLQFIQLIFTAILVPLQAWTLREIVAIGKELAAHRSRTDAMICVIEKQVSELFDRVNEIEKKGSR